MQYFKYNINCFINAILEVSKETFIIVIYPKGTWEDGILRWKSAHYGLLLQDTHAYTLLSIISLKPRCPIIGIYFSWLARNIESTYK